MLTFPLPDGGRFIVIEPGNIARLKQGRPLKASPDVLICFTPDMQEFLRALGFDVKIPEGSKITAMETNAPLSGEQIDAALKKCQHLPEVER